MAPDRPFDFVVLTFPDARAAKVASEGPLWRDLKGRFPSVTFLATTDPYGCRVGSGGGTLAALAEVMDWQEKELKEDPADYLSSKILILHAGGQSSRCPTQMCFGKAWTTFPTTQGLLTPIHIWLDFMSQHFSQLSAGSIAVIAADTMLRIPSGATKNPLLSFDLDSVVVLTVPAPLTTAKNHGVFVLDGNAVVAPGNPVACQRILQKPSLESLTEITQGAPAWIDTGVLVFQPGAANALRKLVQMPVMYGCTRTGLDHLYRDSMSTEEITTFCVKHALSVDLYTHILMALKVTGDPLDRTAYGKKFAKLTEDVADSLHGTLSALKVQLWVEPEGQFLHLGTTTELMEFYNSRSLNVKTEDLTVMQRFAKDIELQSRQHVIASSALEFPPRCSPDSVVYHCNFQTQKNINIGDKSLVEFCNVTTSHIDIGQNCWVSGLRGEGDSAVQIPDGLLVQELALSRETRVYMVLGCHDPIKEASHLYGRPWEDVENQLGWNTADIWGDINASCQSLWNAKIHPIFRADEGFAFTKLFAWLSLLDTGEVVGNDSLKEWIRRPRISLSEIREQADASLEFAFREVLISMDIPNARRKLRDNIFNQLDLIELNDMSQLQSYWTRIYDSLLEWVSNRMFDIAGAIAMRFATLLLTWESQSDKKIMKQVPKDLNTDCLLLRNLFGQVLCEKLRMILNCVNAYMTGLTFEECFNIDFQALSDTFVGISTTCTRVCVGSTSIKTQNSVKTSVIVDRWVVATSPARIDLAGGWSDTPPICFEYGSTVIGAAVLVDGYAPLACRCRIIRGGSGVLLRSESRSPVEWNVNSAVDVELKETSDLVGFDDPTSLCALLKCALICLGFVNSSKLQSSSSDIDAITKEFFGINENLRLEIISTSILPQGSGMGTSSILAGCVLAAIAHCRGNPLSTDALIHLVLELEQRLTTGGGFQDQANGLIGGVKRVFSTAGIVQPVVVKSQRLPMSSKMQQHLNGCLHLVYTGKTRLAKNLLSQCLQRWSAGLDEIRQTVSDLVSNACEVAEAIEKGDLDAVGGALNEYWKQKKVMAGPSSGVEPRIVADVLQSLGKGALIRAGSLCGAGGGGFMVILSRDGVTADMMKTRLDADGVDTKDLVWHYVRLDDIGLVIKCTDEDSFTESLMKRHG